MQNSTATTKLPGAFTTKKMKHAASPNFASYLGEINATNITAAYRKYPTTNELAKQQEARQLVSW
jgi:hypothetical protein